VAAGGVGRLDWTLSEAAAEEDAIAAGSVERSVFCAGCTRVANVISCAGWIAPVVATGWLAACRFDAAAGGVGRLDWTTAEAAAEADAISADSVERAEFWAGCTRVANATSCAGWLGPVVATGWLAACWFDAAAGGVGRLDWTMAEAAVEADAISADSVERSGFCAGCTGVANVISCAG
jgi:hypothetical protein